jgi:hypothetical protein
VFKRDDDVIKAVAISRSPALDLQQSDVIDTLMFTDKLGDFSVQSGPAVTSYCYDHSATLVFPDLHTSL